MNARTGSIFRRGSAWYARVTFSDTATGKRKDIRWKAASKSEAVRLRDSLLRELENSDEKTFAYGRKTFAEFARYYRDTYLQPAIFVEQRKVSGLRSCRLRLEDRETINNAFWDRTFTRRKP